MSSRRKRDTVLDYHALSLAIEDAENLEHEIVDGADGQDRKRAPDEGFRNLALPASKWGSAPNRTQRREIVRPKPATLEDLALVIPYRFASDGRSRVVHEMMLSQRDEPVCGLVPLLKSPRRYRDLEAATADGKRLCRACKRETPLDSPEFGEEDADATNVPAGDLSASRSTKWLMR